MTTIGDPELRRSAQPDACVTCGDVAVALEVVSIDGADAVCRADDGGTEIVAIELVQPVEVGDRVLVHAKVALQKLPGEHNDGLRGLGTL